MKVGVTGAGGLLGSTLVPVWRAAGAEVVGWTRRELDGHAKRHIYGIDSGRAKRGIVNLGAQAVGDRVGNHAVDSGLPAD